MSGQIYSSMIKVMRGITHIGKDRKNQQQGFNFRGIDDVMNELHGVMAECGVFVIPEPVGETNVTERTNAKGTVMRYVMQRWQFTFFAEDGSCIVAGAIGESMDSGDKAMNKSMSIALKYVLLQSFMIPTIEDKDPDSQSHELSAKQQKLPELHDCTKLVEWARSQGMNWDQAIESAEHKYKVSNEMKHKIADAMAQEVKQ